MEFNRIFQHLGLRCNLNDGMKYNARISCWDYLKSRHCEHTTSRHRERSAAI
ncbi:MAG: hypothetical protein LBU70_10660 [Chitinispirillales bacterium]|nr:hypothetical protein [Chitinispirillales bacterium]